MINFIFTSANVNTAVVTPNSNLNATNMQQPLSQNQPNESVENNLTNQSNEINEDYMSLDSEQLQFFEKTDSKFLQEKSIEINKNLM